MIFFLSRGGFFPAVPVQNLFREKGGRKRTGMLSGQEGEPGEGLSGGRACRFFSGVVGTEFLRRDARREEENTADKLKILNW